MKRLLVFVVASAALVTLVPAMSSAASPTDRKVAALQRQVRSLQKQVTALKKQTRFNTSEIGANYTGDACLTALTADLFLGTWATVTESGSFGTRLRSATRAPARRFELPARESRGRPWCRSSTP